jgi:riboflavin biosynthesis pyrimidine reductase
VPSSTAASSTGRCRVLADGRRRPGEPAAAFLRHDLIDEIRVYVHPVVIGEGTPMFQARDAKLSLRLAQNHTFGSGVVLLRYERG